MGCYQDQTRSASEDDLLIAQDRATEEKLLHEFQSIAQSIDPVAALDLNEPDPFELQDYPTHSIWPRVREGFVIDTHLDHPWVQSELDWYSQHPEYLFRTMTRAEPFIHYILEEAEKRGLPTELVLLPIVESAYQPFAYSHGRAAGLWQFIPSTGRLYGLEQTWWYDGRRDIYASTQAALQYLQNLSKLFKGDWTLALAAYNSGSGTVQRAIRKNKKLGKPTDFWHLKLPKETRAYVPKLIALKQLVDISVAYGIELGPLPNEPYFEIVNTGGQIDMAVAAELAGIELEALYRLNPGFNQWATPPKGPHRLLIPVDNASAFRQAIANLSPEKRVQWVRHKIKNGESLGHIAKRYHTTVSALKAANGVNGTSIRAGKHLLVPVSSQGQDSYKLSAQQRLKRKQDRPRKGQKTRHIVSSGDTFWDLSREYKISVRKLAAWNGMAPGDTLRVSQKLVI